MARPADPTLTVPAAVIGTRWAHHPVTVKKAIVIGVPMVVATTTAHALTAKKAADVSGQKVDRTVIARVTT